MSDLDLLHRQLTALENGASLEQILDQLPADDRELRPLLHLAAQIRALEHPELSPGIASAQKRQVIEASRSLDRPVPKPEVPLDRLRWQGPVRVATIGFALFVALFAVTVIVGSMVLGERRRLHQVTLEGVTGTVEVAEDGVWKPVDTGDRLPAGKRVRTGSDSSLTLAFFEGTRTTVGPDTEVTLTTIDGSADTLRLLLTQHTGKTSHIVVPLRGDDSFFVIDTPNGRATVQGTVFDVMVNARGQAFFNVEQGRVKVSGAGQEVLLLAGQSTTTSAGKPPEPLSTEDCTYGKGYWKNHPEEWPVTMLTLGGGTYEQAELLALLGIPPRGNATYILARQLIAAKLNDSAGADTSVISATIDAADAWLTTYPPGSNPTGADRQLGIDMAEILDDYNSGTIGPGSCDDEEPTTTTTITPTVTTTPTIMVTTVVTDCTGADPHPHAETLEDQLGVPYDEIMGWKCSGFGFGEIVHAYNLSEETGIPVADIFEMRRSGLGWGQIRKQLLDGDIQQDGRSRGNPNKDGQDNSHGKKDRGDKDKGNRGQGNSDKGDRDRANNGNGNNGKADLGHGNRGQGNKDKGYKGRGHSGQGIKDK